MTDQPAILTYDPATGTTNVDGILSPEPEGMRGCLRTAAFLAALGRDVAVRRIRVDVTA